MKQILLLATTATVVLAGIWWFTLQLRPVSDVESERYITVEEGMAAGRVAKLLEDAAVIRSGVVFYLYARANNLSHNIQAGFYRFSPTQTPAEILGILTEGQIESMVIRIPGGADLIDIRTVLEEAGFDPNEIEAALGQDYDASILEHKPRSVSLEGYLYPDTYHVAANASAEDLVEMALINAEQKLTEELRNEWRGLGLSVHEGLTLASIVQKEAADVGDQQRAAQVFLRRLEIGQRLEADPTFMYAARLLNVPASINIDSPYNTYRNEGLPPGPIATVEQNALQAVASPADTNYLYFVTGKDGVTRFSATKEQHELYIREHGVSGT